MMPQPYRMTVYDLVAGASCRVAADGHAFVYAARGEATVAGATVAPGDGVFAFGGDVVASTGGAWIYEVTPGATLRHPDEGLLPLLSRVASIPHGSDLMLRADRVESAPGARTPAHRHQGPGIRRLERGCLLAEVDDHLDRIEAGQAWFESGHETVVGVNISGGTNAFIRVMLLPIALAGGKTSFVPANPEEAAKPRAVNLRLFGELGIGNLRSGGPART